MQIATGQFQSLCRRMPEKEKPCCVPSHGSAIAASTNPAQSPVLSLVQNQSPLQPDGHCSGHHQVPSIPLSITCMIIFLPEQCERGILLVAPIFLSLSTFSVLKVTGPIWTIKRPSALLGTWTALTKAAAATATRRNNKSPNDSISYYFSMLFSSINKSQ